MITYSLLSNFILGTKSLKGCNSTKLCLYKILRLN